MSQTTDRPRELLLVLDRDVLDEYEWYYFKQHPRATRPPIAKPRHPSLNEWTIVRRPQMNSLKQKWKEFGMWWATELGYAGLGIASCDITCTTYIESKRLCDPDNYTPKFLNDAWTGCGLLVADDYSHVKKVSCMCGYDKEHPRTEIHFTNIVYKDELEAEDEQNHKDPDGKADQD